MSPSSTLEAPVAPEPEAPTGAAKKPAAFDGPLVRRALLDSVLKLSPRHMARNPVMFVVEVGTVLTTLLLVRDIVMRGSSSTPLWFTGGVTLWLWFTVLFANFAEAMAEGRGKAQADTLRKTRTDAQAKRLQANGQIQLVSATELRRGDIVLVEAGDLIPGDGDVIEGVASVNEAAITGESAPAVVA